MARDNTSNDDFILDEGGSGRPRKKGLAPWQAWLLGWGGLALFGLVFLAITWNSFFVYVKPDHHLVVISKQGKKPPVGQLLAENGEQGILRAVKGEGWHLVMPVLYDAEVHPNTKIEAGKVGIVTTKFGAPLPPGRVLAGNGEQGIQKEVLQPGSHRLNKYAYDVKIVGAVEIEPGFVGVKRRLLGKENNQRFAQTDDEKGIIKEIMQPGLYYLNTEEFAVTPVEVGIVQTTFHHDDNPDRDTAIRFPSKGGLQISMDCTIEWEVLPKDMPSLVAEYGNWREVESKVIAMQANRISRDKGTNFSAQDFLLGSTRQDFQTAFEEELREVCRQKGVTIQSAFVRDIVIPESYLEQIRNQQLAKETELTNKVREATAASEAEVERALRLIEQRTTEVQAETSRLVASIDREAVNAAENAKAQVEKLSAEYSARMAQLDSERLELLGKAVAEAKRLVEVARAGLYQMKMEVFRNDSDAFLRYSMAEKLNPKLMVRLFHSGQGTFWTNLSDKNLSLMLPAAGPSEPSSVTRPVGK